MSVRGLFLLLILFWGVATGASLAATGEPATLGGKPNVLLDISGVALPVVRNGKVINFVFVRARVELSPEVTPQETEIADPRIRAGLVRAAYRTPMNPPNDLMSVDPKLFEAVLLKEARSALGANRVKSVALRAQRSQRVVFLPPPAGERSRGAISP